MENPTYIGDGAYAYFGGNGVELRLGAHDSSCKIYLEPEVLENLVEFRNAIQKAGEAPKG